LNIINFTKRNFVRKRFNVFSIVFVLLLTASLSVHAQLCQGSLGDPIVNITFGTGTNPGPGLSAATTAYQYYGNDCPGDGFYTVRNSTTACFGNTWHSLSSDHTGNGNGYFMLVNASIDPSAFYLDTVKGLCGNTTYEFAAWVVNVLLQSACNNNGNKPNLTFSIEKTDGTALQTYNSGDIPSQSSPVWQQFGFFFTTPASVSDVVLRIFNNAPGGCGNDLALDDITFRACGPKLTPAITGYTTDTAVVCQGQAKSFAFTCNVSPGFNNPVFQWQQNINNGTWTDIPGANTTSLSKIFAANAAAGNYGFRLTASEIGNATSLQCRVVADPLFVNVVANPVPNAGNNGPVCEGSNLQLTATDGTQFAWTGINNFTASGAPATINAIQQAQAGKYFVLVTNSSGCSHLDSTVVKVNPVPTATVSFASKTICTGDAVQLNAGGGIGYTWSPATALSSAGIASPEATPITTTAYVVTVSNQFACTDTATVLITVNEKPTANAGPDKTIIKGRTILLEGSATGQSINYSWQPAVNLDNPQQLQPMANPPAEMDYTLTVTSANGCGTATDAMHVFVFKDIYIPTAFSPNGDGLNDTWKIPALAAFPAFELTVFNRFGQKVFQNKNTNTAWDGMFKGAPLAAGSYVYVIDLNQFPGVLRGSVLIIR
jgi:gliding motility-associated-like protein